MKKIASMLMVCLSGTVLMVCLSCSVLVKAQSNDEKAVTALVEGLRKAMVDGDATGLGKITSDDLSYAHSNGQIDDKATYIKNLASGASNFSSIDLADQTLKIVGDVAIVRHKFYSKTNDNGKEPGVLNLNVLLIFQKQAGQWKLLARHAARILTT